MTLDCDTPIFKDCLKGTLWEGQTLHQLYSKAFTPWEWHKDLKEYANSKGMDLFSSPFDTTAVDFLESLDMPAYKIASPEITDIALIKSVARTGKPVILSTGLATYEDIELAVKTLIDNGCSDYALLKCTTAYPAPPEDINLRTIPDLAEKFNCLSGISDHSLGLGIAISAVTLGAKVIEKHFVLDKNEESVDSFFSLDPAEFKMMVTEVRTVEKALGKISYDLSPASKKNLLAKRSLYISKNVKKGDIITTENIQSVRPSFGLAPKYYEQVLGGRFTADFNKGTRLSLDIIEGDI
jgi:N-acetylneuraminate synthase/pseudaminic acid synthase